MLKIIHDTIDKFLSGELTDFLPDKEAYFVERYRSGFVKDKILDFKNPEYREKIMERFRAVEMADENHVILYRGMSHGKDINLDSLGICWTFEQKKAYCYGTMDKLPFYYVYHAKVPLSSVQWSHTVQKAIVMHSHEKEFRLIEGAPIKIFKVEKKVKTLATLIETFNVDFDTKV